MRLAALCRCGRCGGSKQAMRVRCSDIEPRTPWGIYIYKRARVNETAKGQASASRGERARKKKQGDKKRGIKARKREAPRAPYCFSAALLAVRCAR